MKDFGFAFYGEGGRDYAFTCEIARRAIDRLLLPRFFVTAFPISKFGGGLSDKEQLAQLVNEYYGYRLFIVHYDADHPTTEHVRKTRFEPAYEPIKPTNQTFDVMPIIPVRNTEAWLLADFAAFAKVTGLRGKADDHGFALKPHLVESDLETKEKIDKAFQLANVRREREADLLLEIARSVNLDQLYTLPAFAEFQRDLDITLKSLKFIG
jgi:hypothetical protein